MFIRLIFTDEHKYPSMISYNNKVYRYDPEECETVISRYKNDLEHDLGVSLDDNWYKLIISDGSLIVDLDWVEPTINEEPLQV